MENTAKIRTIALVTALMFSVSACASKPFVPPVMKPNDRNLSCQDLNLEINQAMQHKQMARKDDTFQWRYILIIPAVISIYNWHKAETAAQERIDYLEGISSQRGCMNGGMSSQGMPMGMMRGSQSPAASPFGAMNPASRTGQPNFPGSQNPMGMSMGMQHMQPSPYAAGAAASSAMGAGSGAVPTYGMPSQQQQQRVPSRYQPSGAFAQPQRMAPQHMQQQQQEYTRYGSNSPANNSGFRQPPPAYQPQQQPAYNPYATAQQPSYGSQPTTVRTMQNRPLHYQGGNSAPYYQQAPQQPSYAPQRSATPYGGYTPPSSYTSPQPLSVAPARHMY